MVRSLPRMVGVVAGAACALGSPLAGNAAATYSVGPISNLTATSCSGQNAEVEQAADSSVGS